MTTDTLDEEARGQIRFIQERLLAATRWAESSGIGVTEAEFLLQPYRRLLDEMCQRESRRHAQCLMAPPSTDSETLD